MFSCAFVIQSKLNNKQDHQYFSPLFLIIFVFIKGTFGLTDESLSTIWTEFNGTLVELDILQNECFTDGILLIGDIKTHLTEAVDAYSTASQSVDEWIGMVQPLLSIHNLAVKGSAHKKVLDKALNDGMPKLSSAQKELDTILLGFNPLVSNVKALLVQFDDKFSEKDKCFQSKLKILRAALGSVDRIENELIPKILERIAAYQKFRSDLSKRVQQEFNNIDSMKAKLRAEIQSIGDLKVKLEPVISAMNMDTTNRDDLNKYVKDLIENCKNYHKMHENQ